MAVAGEVLVSSTVKDLVAGSGMRFEERGTHELKGVPDAWTLYAAKSPDADLDSWPAPETRTLRDSR
jgi:class 3 adenylate cyclase